MNHSAQAGITLATWQVSGCRPVGRSRRRRGRRLNMRQPGKLDWLLNDLANISGQDAAYTEMAKDLHAQAAASLRDRAA